MCLEVEPGKLAIKIHEHGILFFSLPGLLFKLVVCDLIIGFCVDSSSLISVIKCNVTLI